MKNFFLSPLKASNFQKKEKRYQKQHENKSEEASDDNIVVFTLNNLELQMLKFFCQSSLIFLGRFDYRDGILVRYLHSTEKEADLQYEFKS